MGGTPRSKTRLGSLAKPEPGAGQARPGAAPKPGRVPAMEAVPESPREKSSRTAQAAEGMLDIASLFASDMRALGAALTPRGKAAAPKPPASPPPPATPPPDGKPPPPAGLPPPLDFPPPPGFGGASLPPKLGFPSPPDGKPPPPDGAPPPLSAEESEDLVRVMTGGFSKPAPTVVPLDPNRPVWGPKRGGGRRGGVATLGDGQVVQAHGLHELHTADMQEAKRRATRKARLQAKIRQTKLMLQRVYHRAFDREPSDSSTSLPTKGKATHVPKLKVGDDHV